MEASQDSKTLLIKEFLELTDAEETFLEEEPLGKWSFKILYVKLRKYSVSSILKENLKSVINCYKMLKGEVRANQDSGTLLKEFFELTDAEETFLERKASIRRSIRSRRKKTNGSQYFVEASEEFHVETEGSYVNSVAYI